jgi:hypothetical protein
VWRKAGFSFSQSATETMTMATESGEARTPSSGTTDVVFGVLDRDLLNGSGGVFFGLIKETDRWIRPSFLGQTGYTSFCVDLRHANANANNRNNNNNDNDNVKSIVENDNKLDDNDKRPRSPRLVLSKQSMIGTGKWPGTNPPSGDINNNETEYCVPLVRDLKTKYGAPVVHYTARASRFVVNGMPLLITKKNPLYVIFDTGVSGMVVSSELFDGRNLQARKNKEKSLWGTVEISFATSTGGKEVTLTAKKPLTTPLGKETPWKGFKGNLIAVGLAFLDGLAMTVDVDDGKILFVE